MSSFEALGSLLATSTARSNFSLRDIVGHALMLSADRDANRALFHVGSRHADHVGLAQIPGLDRRMARRFVSALFPPHSPTRARTPPRPRRRRVRPSIPDRVPRPRARSRYARATPSPRVPRPRVVSETAPQTRGPRDRPRNNDDRPRPRASASPAPPMRYRTRRANRGVRGAAAAAALAIKAQAREPRPRPPRNSGRRPAMTRGPRTPRSRNPRRGKKRRRRRRSRARGGVPQHHRPSDVRRSSPRPSTSGRLSHALQTRRRAGLPRTADSVRRRARAALRPCPPDSASPPRAKEEEEARRS